MASDSGRDAAGGKSLTRCRIYMASVECLRHYFARWSNMPERMASIQLPSIPEDSTILNVSYNQNRRCLDVLIYHESFKNTPLGEEFPRFPAMEERMDLVKKSDYTCPSETADALVAARVRLDLTGDPSHADTIRQIDEALEMNHGEKTTTSTR